MIIRRGAWRGNKAAHSVQMWRSLAISPPQERFHHATANISRYSRAGALASQKESRLHSLSKGVIGNVGTSAFGPSLLRPLELRLCPSRRPAHCCHQKDQCPAKYLFEITVFRQTGLENRFPKGIFAKYKFPVKFSATVTIFWRLIWPARGG